MSLKDLISAVERGEYSDSMFCAMFHSQGLCTECEGAFHGSLDAAKRLHDALLPGWEWHLGPSNAKVYPYNGSPLKSWSGMADNAARAWLLAILRALDDQREGGE